MNMPRPQREGETDGEVGVMERRGGVESERLGYGCSGSGARIKSGIDDTSCKTGFDFTGHFQLW